MAAELSSASRGLSLGCKRLAGQLQQSLRGNPFHRTVKMIRHSPLLRSLTNTLPRPMLPNSADAADGHVIAFSR